MNKDTEVQIKAERAAGFYLLTLTCVKKGVENKLEIRRLIKYGDWELSDTQQVMESANRILENFLFSERREPIEFPYPYNHRIAWTIEEDSFGQRGVVYYDRKQLY